MNLSYQIIYTHTHRHTTNTFRCVLRYREGTNKREEFSTNIQQVRKMIFP